MLALPETHTYHASYELDCRRTFSGILSSPRNSSPNFRLLAFQRSTLKKTSTLRSC